MLAIPVEFVRPVLTSAWGRGVVCITLVAAVAPLDNVESTILCRVDFVITG